MKQLFLFFTLLLLFAETISAAWKPADTPIQTRWGKTVTPENAWTEYPRPQWVRKDWQNLNGLWEYAVTRHDAAQPGSFQGQILVPFPIDSALSGVQRTMKPNEDIWYRRSVEIPTHWKHKRVLLNFEAADWQTTAWVNGTAVGSHRGGYTPFSFDITDALTDRGEQTLVVKVWDPQDTIFKSLGKQSNSENQYNRCSGIWQTVWMEPVSATHIQSVKVTPSATGTLEISTKISGPAQGVSFRFEALADGKPVLTARSETGSLTMKIPAPKTWSPESPFLYDLNVYLIRGNDTVDTVRSYFGLRTITLKDSPLGKQMALNGKPVFQMGPLDQNYWPGGGLAPPSDEAMIWECQYLKDIGCNMVRLHIKQNPRRWYYHCDRMGLLVWQDFITSQKGKRFDQVSAEDSALWLGEQKQMMDSLHSHPSIIKWIVFNEAWGQHDTGRILNWAMEQDPSRIVSVASGWYDLDEGGHIRDLHDYTFYPAIPALGTEPNRAVVLGETGGFAGAVPPHNWTGRSNQTGTPDNFLWGGFDPSVPRDDNRIHDIFRPTYTFGKPFEEQYAQFARGLLLLKNNGLTAAIYTQMTDMKLEENGWLTFDREISKIDVSALREIHTRLYSPPPDQRALLPSSLDKPQEWTYSFAVQNGDRWANENFDDKSWQTGTAPFGHGGKIKSNTRWEGGNLYLRKTFDLKQVPDQVSLRLYSYLEGSNNSEWIYSRIYLNGQLVQDEQTRQFKPEWRVTDIPLWPEAVARLKRGKNIIAVEVMPGMGGRANDQQIQANGRDLESLVFDLALMEVSP